MNSVHSSHHSQAEYGGLGRVLFVLVFGALLALFSGFSWSLWQSSRMVEDNTQSGHIVAPSLPLLPPTKPQV